MKFNKCVRCGCFFATANAVCPNCQAKDENDINQLKSFLSEADTQISVEALAFATGVSVKNVNRFLQNKNLNKTFTNLGLYLNNSENNINISL